MIKLSRIEINEKRLDDLESIASKLDLDLEKFENLIKDYHLLNRYYGSEAWFKDKKNFEEGKIKDVKAGVLSEDAVWNLDERISDIVSRMKVIVEKIK